MEFEGWSAVADGGSQRVPGGFRRFLGNTKTQTELAKSENPPTRPRPFRQLSATLATEVRPPAVPVSKAANFPAPPKKRKPDRERRPTYVWRSQASKETRSAWAECRDRPF